MSFALTQLFSALLEVSLQSLPVIILVLFLRLLLGSRVPARWRSRLWSVVLLRLLVPLSLLPSSSASLENLQVVNKPSQDVQVSVEQSLQSPVFVPEQSATPKIVIYETKNSAFAESSPAPSTPLLPEAEFKTHPAATPVSWMSLLAMLWLAGFTACVCYVAGAQVMFSRRIEAQRVSLPDPLSVHWLDFCRKQNVKRPPQLLVSRAVDSPVLMGFFKTILVLPANRVNQFTLDEYEHIFAHELGHYCQGDNWLQAFQLGTAVLHWFNPLVWYGLSLAEIDRELAADEWALRHLKTPEPEQYAKTLLKLVVSRSYPRMIPLNLGILEDSRQIIRRVKGIILFKRQRLVESFFGLIVLVGASVLVLSRSAAQQSSAVAPNPVTPTLTPPPSASPNSAAKKRTISPDDKEYSTIRDHLELAQDAELHKNDAQAISIEKDCYGQFMAFHEKWPEYHVTWLISNLGMIKADLARLGDHTVLPELTVKPGAYQHLFATTNLTIHQKPQRANGFLESYLPEHCEIPVFRDYDIPLTSAPFKPDFDNASLKVILDTVCQNNGFTYDVRDDGIHIRVTPLNLTRDSNVDNDTVHDLDPYHAISNPRRGWNYIDLHSYVVRFPDSYEAPLGSWIKFTGANGQVSYAIVSEYGTEHECVDYDVLKAMSWDFKLKAGHQPIIKWQIVPADQVPQGPWLQGKETAPDFTKRWVATLEISKQALGLSVMNPIIKPIGEDRLKLMWETYSSPPSYCSPVTYAIYSGEPISTLDRLVAQGESLEAPISEPCPLTMAAATGNLPAFKWLIDHGADLHLKAGKYDTAFGYGRYSPFDVACENEQTAIVNYMLEHGNPQPDQNLLSALMWIEDSPVAQDMIDKLAAAGKIQPLVPPKPDPKSKVKEDPQAVKDQTDGQNRYEVYYAASLGKSDYLLKTLLKQGFNAKGFLDRGSVNGLTIAQALQAEIDQLRIPQNLAIEAAAKEDQIRAPMYSSQSNNYDFVSDLLAKRDTLARRIAIIQSSINN